MKKKQQNCRENLQPEEHSGYGDYKKNKDARTAPGRHGANNRMLKNIGR